MHSKVKNKRIRDGEKLGNRPVVAAILGIIVLAFIVFLSTQLDSGTTEDHIFVDIMLVVIVASAIGILFKESINLKTTITLLLPICVALLIRVCFFDQVSGDYRNFLSRWCLYFRENGGFKAIAGSVGDYNVPYLYFLALISYLPTPDIYLIKILSILFDVILAWGGFRLVYAVKGPEVNVKAPIATFILLLFVPTVVLNSSYWAQCDSIYCAFILHALANAISGKTKSSIILLGVAFSIKLQTVFMLPFWIILWFANKIKLHEFLLFPAAYAATILPAVLLGKPLKDILGVYWTQVNEYNNQLSFNAPSIFRFIPFNANVNVKSFAIGGIFVAAILVVALFVVAFQREKGISSKALLSIAVVLSIGVPFFLPFMHDRYFYLADVLCACWVCCNAKRIPIAILVWGASLSSYVAYFRGFYSYVYTAANGDIFPLITEAIAMGLALFLSIVTLGLDLRRKEQAPRRSIKINKSKQ